MDFGGEPGLPALRRFAGGGLVDLAARDFDASSVVVAIALMAPRMSAGLRKHKLEAYSQDAVIDIPGQRVVRLSNHWTV